MSPCRLTLLAVLLLALPCAAQEKGRRYALVVGVNKYTNRAFPPLEFAQNDADEVAAVLKKAGFQVNLLSTKPGCTSPTANNIRKAVEELVTGRKETDTVLIALAGHGVQLEVEDPEGKEKSRTYPYFCPHDAETAGISFSTGNAKRLINLNWLFRQLEDRNCSAGRKLILVDACRNLGKAVATERRTRSIDAKRVTVPDGVCAMFSCAPGQVAYEHAKLGKGHGIFFWFVLEGLRGKGADLEGAVTWNSLGAYVSRQMVREVGKLTDGNKQTPHLVANIVGEPPVLVEKVERVPVVTKKVPVTPVKPAALAGEKDYLRGLELGLGRGTKIDRPGALASFRRASQAGHPLGQAEYAAYLLNGVSCDKDEKEAQRLARLSVPALRKMAAEGRVEAMSALGRCLQFGLGAPKDLKQAFHWYSQAAERGDVRSQNNLAVMYDQGLFVKKDPAEAVKWFQKAADAGYVPSYFNLALMYEHGVGVPKSVGQAAKWYRKAAEMDDRLAQSNLGALCLRARADHEALKWFRRSAELKCPAGLFNMGLMYEQGRGGLTKDEYEATRYYRLAADAGDSAAQNNMGYRCQMGKGTKKSEAEAVRWFRKAAAQNHAGGLFNLGVMYEHGRGGLSKDRDAAIGYYRRAAAKGFGPAKTALKNLGAS